MFCTVVHFVGIFTGCDLILFFHVLGILSFLNPPKNSKRFEFYSKKKKKKFFFTEVLCVCVFLYKKNSNTGENIYVEYLNSFHHSTSLYTLLS